MCYASGMENSEATCPFCTQPEIKERTIIANALVWAFPTNIPITPGHTLIVPNRCVATLADLTPDERTALFEVTDLIRQALVRSFEAEGFNYAWNEGKAAGQSVGHFHLHVVPRKAGDEGVYEYEPRQFLYRPGSREASPEAELLAVTEIIKKNL